MLLTDGVWRVSGRASNVYLVDDDGAWTLVDAGIPQDETVVRGLLAEAGIEPGDVTRVLLTHYDLDHIGTLATLGLSCPVFAADPDAAHLEGSARPPLTRWKGLTQRLSGLLASRPDIPVERVSDRGTVGGFVAHRTPGHTPGHVVWVHEGTGVALVGDLVRERDGAMEPSPWFLSDDSAAVTDSVARLRDRAPRVRWLCPGHGEPLEAGIEALPVADR